MNSKSIKIEHSEIYKNFFSKNNLVISLPFLLNWAGDIFSNYTGIRIKQKLPFRIYLGVNKIKERKIIFKTISYLDLNEDKFIETNLEEYAPFFCQYLKYFNEEYREYIKENGGVEITILSELSRGTGLGFNSIVSLLIIIALEKNYKNQIYINQNNIEINDLLNSNTNIDRLFRKSLKLNKDLGIRINRVENQISSFFDSYYPIISFLEDYENDINNIDIETINIYGYRLNDMEKSLSDIPFIPIDYGLIYSGRPVLTDNIVNTNEMSFNWTSDVKNKLNGYFKDTLEDTLPVRKPVFYKTFVSEKGDVFKDTYGKLMGAISLEMLNLMIKLYSNSYIESNMRSFIDIINKVRHGNYITRKSSKVFYDFLSSIFDNFPAKQTILGLAPSDTTIMGGTAIFVTPYEGLRKDLGISVKKTKELIPGVRFLYSNWKDGIENKGFLVEQDLHNKVYSEFIGKNNIILENSKGLSMIIDNDYLNDNIVGGLTLDLITKKIYLDSKKLTSKEIHSQNTTIDILQILLDRIGEEISNKDFPKSSYSSNKNDMLGKIVLPLVKLIKNEKNIKFPLSCKGSLGDFYLKLKPSELDINIIKKIS